MNAEQLTFYLHREIPLTAAGGLQVAVSTPTQIEVHAPLSPNRNPHGTVFGGSLAMIGIVTGWTLVHRALHEAGIQASLVVRNSDCEYVAPARGEVIARAALDAEAWQSFLQHYRDKGRARLEVETLIDSEGVRAVVHRGVFVALAHQDKTA